MQKGQVSIYVKPWPQLGMEDFIWIKKKEMKTFFPVKLGGESFVEEEKPRGLWDYLTLKCMQKDYLNKSIIFR